MIYAMRCRKCESGDIAASDASTSGSPETKGRNPRSARTAKAPTGTPPVKVQQKTKGSTMAKSPHKLPKATHSEVEAYGFTRSENELKANGKPDFAPFVKILQPTSTSNHVKFKNALVKTILELLNLNICSAMNSSTDVLGQFYEVFLKYGNGAKEIGIVLTPRHVTRFAVDAVGVSDHDIVLDV